MNKQTNEDRNANFQANGLGCQFLILLFLCHSQLCSWQLAHSRWSTNVYGTREWEVSACVSWAAKPIWPRPRQVCCLNLLVMLIHSAVSKYTTRAYSTMKTQIKTSCVERFQYMLRKGTPSPSLMGEKVYLVPQHPDATTRECLRCHKATHMQDLTLLAMLQPRQRLRNVLRKLNHHRHQGVYPYLKRHYLSFWNFNNSSKMKNQKCAKSRAAGRIMMWLLGKAPRLSL